MFLAYILTQWKTERGKKFILETCWVFAKEQKFWHTYAMKNQKEKNIHI
jgi:hypothetical protein